MRLPIPNCVGLPLLIVAFGSAWAPAFGGDSASEAALKGKGLARAGRVFVDEAAEKPVLERIKEIRGSSFATYIAAAEKQAAAEQLQMQSAELEQQRVALQANLNGLNQQIRAQTAAMGSGRVGRLSRMSGPTPAQVEHQQVTAAMNETAAMQKSVKAQIPSAKDKATLDADVKRKGDAFKSDLTELRTKVDEVTKKYADLNEDEAVKKSLLDLEKVGHAKVTVGPSEAFTAGMKELDQAERRFLGKKSTHAAKKAKSKK